MDSNETRSLLKKLLGGVGYALVKPFLQTVKIKIDAEKRHVLITKDDRTHVVKFDEIEELVNEQV